MLDPSSLAAAHLRRAKATLQVPAEWLAGSCEVEFTVPRRLSCEGCEGGGCGDCQNRGGFTVPDDAPRRLEVALSEQAPSAGLRVRVVPDFAEAAGFDVLLLDVRVGAPTLGARRRSAAVGAPAAATTARAPLVPLAVAVALFALLLVLMATR